MQSSLYLQGFRLERPATDQYWMEIPAIRSISSFSFAAPVTFFVGENGSGKSTLLEALAVACGFNAEGGSRNFSFATNATHSGMHAALRPVRSIPFAPDGFFLRAESFYNVATEIDALKDRGLDDGDRFLAGYGGRSLHHQSHGESFFSLAMHRFRGGLYILDEPEAALSPSRQLALLARIHELARRGSQFIIATHSPILMACPASHLYLMTDAGPRRTDYRDTDHYRVTRQFLEDPRRTLHYLLEDPPQEDAP